MTARGFTLLEVMMVVIIVGVLASLALPRYQRTRCCDDHREAQAVTEQVFNVLVAYHSEHNAFVQNYDPALQDWMMDPNVNNRGLTYTWGNGAGNSNDPDSPEFHHLTVTAVKDAVGCAGRTTIRYDANKKRRCMEETGWPCPLINDPFCDQLFPGQL